MGASDYQETKNVNTSGSNVMPNTRVRGAVLHVVSGPALTWIAPEARSCTRAPTRLLVVARSTRPVRSVRFLVDGRRIARVKRQSDGLYPADWRIGRARRGAHRLRAVVTDAAGRRFAASRTVRVCARR
jgi:hypothetical protein